MMEFVNGKDDIPYILENNPVMFETTRNSSAALISSDLDLTEILIVDGETAGMSPTTILHNQ